MKAGGYFKCFCLFTVLLCNNFFYLETVNSKAATKKLHHLSIIIPFRDRVAKNSQGANREQNLKDWSSYMCNFLNKVWQNDAHVHIIEQIDNKSFNKGALFNIGYQQIERNKKSDYIVLHTASANKWDYEYRDWTYKTSP